MHERIGIIMLTAVGDAVHVLPVVNAIKRHSPRSHISWMLQPGPAALVRGHPSVDELLVFDRSRGWTAFLDARHVLDKHPFDVVLDLQSYFKAGVLTALARAPRKIGYDRARARDLNWLFTTDRLSPQPRAHIQDEYLEFLDALSIPHGEPQWGLGPWPEERAWQSEFLARFDRPIVPLVIGSSKPAKDWLPERWAQTADILYEKHGVQPMLVGGPSPRERTTEAFVMRRAKHPVISALDSGLRRLVSILDAAPLVISVDTGPLHIAVALGRPVISLMGYADPRRVGPYRASHDLMVDAYHEGDGSTDAVSTRTYLDRMQRITVSDVADRLAIWETRYRGALSPR
ncbi:MAG: glycosyltransferase family 9 protein [Gemmatimonadota bacterium]|nr:glycosyltransferase family 9 protein [Gemmatimonadota bacterium]